ncbi:hypothetical protein ACIBEJ_04535 [Nonomuraea sp. NPDC050790]|uniref:hypothetical protein n=1 Tax=Nonomuraea sp. NPDC050790 TaxID=3364371 RepID=UPI0037A9E49F
MDHMLEHGPVGLWRSATGTAAAVFGEEMLFAGDGTGELRGYSALFGEEREPFTWRMVARARIGITMAGDQEEMLVEMELRRQASDVGESVVMAEPGSDGFGPAAFPLAFIRSSG